MKLIEAYALSCGLKISKPFILDKFFPLDFDKYIVIHPFSKPSKSYDYWNDVIDIIKPSLDELKISIIQIGGQGEKNLKNCFNLQGKTNLNQCSYLLKNALCLAGADSFSAHIAGSYDLKTVTLYSNSNPENAGQYWGSKNNQITIVGDRRGEKASYALEESPKTINSIPPEAIAKAICKHLDIDLNYPFETVYVGKHYIGEFLTVFPCSSLIQHDPSFSPELRMDLHFDENILAQQLERNKCIIVSDRPISLDILKKYKPQIAALIYLLKKDDNPSFVRDVKKLGLNLFCFTHLSEAELENKKINYYDTIKINRIDQGDEASLLKLKNSKGLYYSSRQHIFSNGQLFNSQEAFLRNMPSSQRITPVIDSDRFWQQMEDFRILKRVA